MSEYGEYESREAMLAAVHAETNAKEEKYREGFLRNFLFHHHVYRSDQPDISPHPAALTLWELAELHAEFMREKQGKNMGDMYDLALSPKYLDRIHVVEVGKATEFSPGGEADMLKKDYIDLRKWMKDHGLIQDEISRSASGRTLDVTVPECTKERIVIGRNRPLIDTVAHNVLLGDGKYSSVAIEIGKRMVFNIPTGLFIALASRDPQFESEETKACIEDLLEKNDGTIVGNRTAYYLRTEVVRDTPEIRFV